MSHNLYFSLISVSFETKDFILRLLPLASSTESKNRFESPQKIYFVFQIIKYF